MEHDSTRRSRGTEGLVMNIGSTSVPLLFVLAIAASGCDGPNERSGREADRAAAAAQGVNMSGEGSNELIGEAQDRAERAARKAVEARADALEDRADQLRREADAEAEKLDQQARAAREAQR
jgi:hypothetical protein